jgi:hypothetical protein
VHHAIIDRVEKFCQEARRSPGRATFWFTQDNISEEDLLQVSADLGARKEHGFMIKGFPGKWRICFWAHQYEKRLFGLLNPYVMKTTYAASTPIDLESVTDADIQEWFEYLVHNFKKQYRPRLLKGESPRPEES